MARTEAEWAAWAREHRAAFQTVPLIETVPGGERVQFGFSLTLYVAAPTESSPGRPARWRRSGSCGTS